jgi:hypothetical protein
VKVEVQVELLRQIEHAAQLLDDLIVTVNVSPQQRGLAHGMVAALVHLSDFSRDLLARCEVGKHIQRRERHALQCDAATPGIALVLKHSQRARCLGCHPVQVRAHRSRTHGMRLGQGTLHAAAQLGTGPAVAVRGHKIDGFGQVALGGTHLVDHVGFVQVNMHICKARQQRAQRRLLTEASGDGVGPRIPHRLRGPDVGDAAIAQLDIEVVKLGREAAYTGRDDDVFELHEGLPLN